MAATLPDEVLELTFRLAVACERDKVIVAREVRRRRVIRAAALVCRRWSGLATAVMGETLIARRLGDFEAIDRAADEGTLQLERVRTVVLDETRCRDLDGVERAWSELEAQSGPVDRTAQLWIDEMYDAYLPELEEIVLEDFSAAALNLVRRLPALRRVRSAVGLTFERLPEDWPVPRLTVESVLEDAEDWGFERWSGRARRSGRR